jgi:hypothetical protein
MEYVRWYDKNPELKEAFEFIEGLDISIQEQIAQDMIQILMNDFGLNSDSEINRIFEGYTYECKRWYDQNIDFFTSFEIIKFLPEGVQHEVVKRILDTVMLIYIGEK